MTEARRVAAVAVATALVAVVPSSIGAAVPDFVPEVPVLSTELDRGFGSRIDQPPVAPTPKVIDGDVSDWTGKPTGFGGTVVHSAGELVYQDHLFDARGSDDGTDAARVASYETLTGVEPRTYRIEPLIGQDAPSQFGLDTPAALKGDEHYGDAGLAPVADIVEARVASAAGGALDVLVRTTTMASANDTEVLVLADVASGGGGTVPFDSGLTSERADVAFLLADSGGWVAELPSGAATPLSAGSVATDPTGWTNAVEARLPASWLGAGDGDALVALAVATRPAGGGGIANVAFRFNERVRTWFEREQALALHTGSIDPFLARFDPRDLAAGRTETYQPHSGYHDRIFRSADGISREQGLDGVWQHYGLYLPDGWDEGSRFPLQWWFHWRGGHAHSAASVIPRMFQTLGDGEAATPATSGIPDSVVVAPRGRGTSTWYVGWGHADFLEVWNDVFAVLAGQLDERRVYVSGHSMGGWASYLFPILYPDRFAGSMPYAGPVTQGAWTGIDFPGCDGFAWEENTPCYVGANGSRPRDQHTRRLLENVRHVPLSVMQGAADELVPVSGVTRQIERLIELGYQHRYYLFPAYEHYSHPIADEWADAGRYVHRFTAPESPARVTYVRDVAFEAATEEVQAGGFAFDFDFDGAYWMRGLTPAGSAAQARFDGRSLALPDPATVTTPEAGGPAPGQYGPFLMTGLAWTPNPVGAPPPTTNGFDAALKGASAVELDLERMGLSSHAPLTGVVSSDAVLTLRLTGGFASVPPVTCDCGDISPSLDGLTLVVTLPAGTSHLTIG